MQIYVFRNAEEVASAASMVFAAQLYQKPDSVLGLATGSTPIPTYRALIDLAQRGLTDFSRARTFNLDEYVGLAPDHPQAYRRFMDEQLFRHIPIHPDNTHVPSGLGDPAENARAYDRMIEAAGGIDLQLLGIGHNGHIGFNEPAEDYTWGTHVVTLTDSTREANARWFDDPEKMPREAISLGIGGIMKARRVLLIATGADKAGAVARAAKGPVSPDSPASILRFHPNAQLMLDGAAASELQNL
jgi:glucosamine-6-phosphate deaminase